MLGNSAVVVVVVRTRPRAIPLANITTRKSTHGFSLSFPCMMSMGLRLAALRAAGAPLLSSQTNYQPGGGVGGDLIPYKMDGAGAHLT